MEAFGHLLQGLAIAATPQNLLWCFIGCFWGSIVGVLPGLGPNLALVCGQIKRGLE